MIAITACAAALAVVTVGLLLLSEYEKKHFVTDQYEIESPKLPDGAAFRCVFLSDLAALDKPTSGEVLLNGKNLVSVKEKEI